MIKKLTRHGNSMALVIDRPIFELLQVDGSTPLEISTDGQVLIVSPIREESRSKNFEKALQKINQKYEKVLQKLAD